jgi:hypothetical protein
MLTLIEKILFAFLVLASLSLTYITFGRMVRTVLRGQGKIRLDQIPKRLVTAAVALFNQGRIIRHRKIASIFHYGVAWSFILYGLANPIDVLIACSSPFSVPYLYHILVRTVLRVKGRSGSIRSQRDW